MRAQHFRRGANGRASLLAGLVLGAVIASLALSSAAGATPTASFSFTTDTSWTVNGSPAAVINPSCYAGYGAWTTALGFNWIGTNSCAAPPPVVDRYSKTFNVPGTPTAATIGIAADNQVSLYVNGTIILSQVDAYNNFHLVTTLDIAPYLHSGSNTIDAVVTNTGTGLSVSGVVARVSVTYELPDTTPPSDHPVVSPGANGAGWNSADVTVNWNWTDGGSGIDAANCSQSSTSAGEGAITLTSTCRDLAGNSASDSVTVNVDKTAPADHPVASPAANGAGWNNSDVAVSWNWSDGGSGLDAANCTQSSTSTGEGSLTLTSTCRDLAGNSASDSLSVKVDKAAPGVAYSGNVSSYMLDQTVSILCSSSDALSGIASSTCAGVSGPAWSFGLGSHTYSASATDNAGNQGSGSTTFTVKVEASSLCALVTQWARNAGIANSLCVKLKAAAAAAARGQTKTKQNNIAAFNHEVSAQSGKGFTAAQASLLVQFAAAV